MSDRIAIRRLTAGLALACVAWLGIGFERAASAAVDSVSILVNKANATGNKSIGTFAYDPISDSIYVGAFGFTGTGGNAAIRKVTNLNGVQVSTPYVSEAQIRDFGIDFDTNRGWSGPIFGGMLLNPQAIGTTNAYSMALFTDASLTRLPASTTTDPAATKRILQYNLQPTLALDSGTGNYIASASPATVLTTKVTLTQLNNAAGVAAGNTSSNTARQFAWSGDGQSIYFLDSSTTATSPGGLFRYNVATGTTNRLFSNTGVDSNTEPAVVTNATKTIDTIYFEGGLSTLNTTTGLTGTNNGGIDYVTYNTTTGVTSPRTVKVGAADLKDFFESTSTTDTPAMGTDSAGNLYFGTVTTGERGIYRLDPQGRLVKVMSAAERAVVSPGSNAQTLRMQTRDITYTGPTGPYPLTQLLFSDSNLDGILAVNLFQPGDFNRDNNLTSADIGLFKSELTVRGVVKTDSSDFKFDLNGNSTVDWKDVKILQSFFDLGTGDTDMNGVVDFADFQILQNNFDQTGKTWIDGDFNGDNAVTFADFQLLQNGFGYQSSILTGAPLAAFDDQAWENFLTSVPEPSTYVLGLLGMLGMAAIAQRKPADAG